MTKFIKFEKDGCMPCRKMDTILKKMGVEYEVVNVEDEESEELVNKYSIFSTPTLLKIIGKGFDKLIGIQHTTQEFEEFCEVKTSEDISEETRVDEDGCCKDGVCSF